MLKDYANQLLSYERAGDLNEYNEPTYAAADVLYGRKEATNKMIRSPEGLTVVANTLVMTERLVFVNDKVDGRIVVSVEPMIGLTGWVLFYEVYLI